MWRGTLAVVDATECPSCGAPEFTAGTVCVYCGAEPAPPVEGRDRIGVPEGASREAIPNDLPPAREARRIRGLGVPLVAALVVLGIGYPLTALAVSRVGRLPATPTDPSEGSGAAFLGPSPPGVVAGRVRLAGAVTYDGRAAPLGCMEGIPRLVTFGSGTQAYSILLSVPAGSGPGSYPLDKTGTFVAVNRMGGGAESWTSLRRPRATGTINLGTDSTVSARFSGLEPTGGGATGTIEGTLEVRCG